MLGDLSGVIVGAGGDEFLKPRQQMGDVDDLALFDALEQQRAGADLASVTCIQARPGTRWARVSPKATPSASQPSQSSRSISSASTTRCRVVAASGHCTGNVGKPAATRAAISERWCCRCVCRAAGRGSKWVGISSDMTRRRGARKQQSLYEAMLPAVRPD
jgi:hypothetical protein